MDGGDLCFLLSLLAACGERETTPPAVSGSGASSVGPITAGGSSGPAGSSSSSSSSTGDTDPASSSGTAGPSSGPGSVETGSDTPCGGWAERYVECVVPSASVAATEATCEAQLLGYEEYGAPCRNALEERFVCLTGLSCQDFINWELDRAVPNACADVFAAVEQTCPTSGGGTTTG